MKSRKKMFISVALILSLVTRQSIELEDILSDSVEIYDFFDVTKVNAMESFDVNAVSDINVAPDYDESDVVINDLANGFGSLYGIEASYCYDVIKENIDCIINSDNPIKGIMSLININIAAGSCGEPIKKDNLLGTGTGNVSYVNKYKKSDFGKAYLKYCSMYGVDCNLALALAKQESNLNHESHLPGGSAFNGFAYGISQIENTLIGTKFTVYNHEKKCKETIKIVSEYPSNPESGITYLSVYNYNDNVRIGVAKLQEKLRKYDYNLAMALQAYNFGDISFKRVLNVYSKDTGKSINYIVKNKTNFGWMKYVDKYHFNPNAFGANWNHGTYGDRGYVNHVAQYISEPILEFTTEDGSTLLINSYDQSNVKISKDDINKLKKPANIEESFDNVVKTLVKSNR